MDYGLFIPIPTTTPQIGCEACVCVDDVLCVFYMQCNIVWCCVVRFDVVELHHAIILNL
jgi:hypothetical protein